MTTSVTFHFVTRRTPFKVTLTPITEEQYRALYPDIWATQKREQYHGRCMCTKRYLWKCDGQCDLCEYHAPDTTSLDEPLPDSKPSIEDIYADRDLLKHLITRFREIDPDADRIIQMRLDNPKISDRKIAEALGRPQRTFADQMKRYYTELHKIENK
ncbi:sigma-70 family RNA polymerase sigma factor [Parablautia intestinalis]|uniref:sigma-70 family RNA polymerase sigma factor n=1 Tax=Parablautia intestinalis TaxID=2320100 RepID=UPI00256EAD50|nr:sigma-70 family RNA polymerase sigma factor [Parablautia intestinalis]